MKAYTSDELLAFLNDMLEAERAGAKALLHISKEARDATASARRDPPQRWRAQPSNRHLL